MGSQKKIKVFLLVAFALIALAAIAYYSRLFVPNTVKPGSFTTQIVERGQVISATDATGIVESENEVLVLSPGTGIIQSILAEPGSRVKKGDLILQLNTDAVSDQIENIKDQLEVRRNSLKRTRLNAQSTRLDLEYNEEVKKLRIANLESQLADQKQLLDVGGISPARLDQTEQEITLAEKDLKTLVEKNSIRLQQLEAEEQGLLLQIGMQEKNLDEQERLLEKMSIRAPSDGIILTINGQEGEKVGTDNLLVRLSDLTSFKISGSVEEQHAKQLKTGNKVIVMVDGEQLEGTVGNITPRVENNKVQFNVHLQQSSHPKLIANQQVQIQIINSLKNNTLRIRKIPDFEDSKKQKKFIVEGDKAIQKEFTLGIIGNEYCEILSGLNEGDIVVTEGLNAFRHIDEIEIQK
ncbi:HlyD family secretion protein [Tangfeifania diversioriginum]|uniref:HlyD family secretion protein n=1 Tax=Tangfeifania diversioriginum TaxID=1168035 RepID=A0A1M6KE16_9BACT|nr:HlyD family efflux transporter periplasmic adaptor subunit [Tangfeifania diversioriginum]SHJ57170.1 HlyD family secretion protein [Tangfeifania diversioriginum]